jgi:hypothetical protein
MIEGISAVTLGTHEMPRAVRFYRRPIKMGPTGNVSEQGFDGSGQHYRNRSTGVELNMSEGSSPLESWSLRTSACAPHVGRRVDFDFRHFDRLMTSTVRSTRAALAAENMTMCR